MFTEVTGKEIIVRERPEGTIVLRAVQRSEFAHSVFTAADALIATVVLDDQRGWVLNMFAEATWTHDMLHAAMTLHGLIDTPDETPRTPRTTSNWTPGQGMDPNRGRGHGHWDY